MVMMVMPLRDAIVAARNDVVDIPAFTINLSPQGKSLTQNIIKKLSFKNRLILIAGRYEGVDERLIDLEVDAEYSIGDYVLSGGEFAAMTLIDAITRLLPGALGDAESAEQDSFSSGLLDYPHYTRPENFVGQAVPEVLLSGDHAAIARWRLKQSLGRTWLRRPELMIGRGLNSEETLLLNEFIVELHDPPKKVENF